jgi:hypothetical protein
VILKYVKPLLLLLLYVCEFGMHNEGRVDVKSFGNEVPRIIFYIL